MKNIRTKSTEKENVINAIRGLETDRSTFNMNEDLVKEEFERKEKIKFNEEVDKYVDKFNSHAEALKNYAESISDSLHNLEIMPIINYVLIKPFDQNPFQKISVSESGLITDLGGAKPKFKNTDTGEIEEEENFIHVGTVLEAGKECKYLKPGDVVMWGKMGEIPVPFYRQGLVLVNETRIIVVINEGLKKRFNME